jgi:ribosome-associated translation inhibitor RaiA/cold shock CspA family protein
VPNPSELRCEKILIPGLASERHWIGGVAGLASLPRPIAPRAPPAPRNENRTPRSGVDPAGHQVHPWRIMAMQVPLEIAFHNTESSEWAESEFRSRVAELEEIYGRLISCRVRVDQRAENRAGTIPPVVRIELGIHGHKDLVVSHEPEHLLRKYQHPDLRNAIHEAFRIAQRRLRDLKEQRESRTKEPRHDSENQSLGHVVELTPDADHGFLLTKEGGLLYFHRNAVLIGDFDRLDRGDEVYYVEDLGDTGPIAAKVRVKAED